MPTFLAPRTSEADSLPDALTMSNVGSELRALREARGLSQTTVAARARLPRPQMSRIESGQYIPSLKQLIRLLDALDAHLIIEAND